MAYAIVNGKNIPISRKHAIEIGDHIRGKSLVKAKEILNKVISKKLAIPFKRFKRDIGHKRGMAAGRYPVKASKEILKLLNSAEANALYKGLKSEDLFIEEFIANKGSTVWRYGRNLRRKAKRTHIKIKLSERKKEGKK